MSEQTSTYDPLAGVGEVVNVLTGKVEEPAPEAPVGVESSPHEGPIVEWDPDQPWARWPRPELRALSLRSLGVAPGAPGSVYEGRLGLYGPEGLLGYCSEKGLRELGWSAQFPTDFIGKLTPEVAAAAINDRLQHSPDREYSVVMEDGRFTNLAPAWREVLAYGDAAQLTLDALRTQYGSDVEVKEAELGDGVAHCRFFAPVEEPITPKVGDVLKLGLDLRHSYGEALSLDLYTERLLCLNGMRGSRQEYTWNQRSLGTAESQAAWLQQGVLGALSAYQNLVDRSRRMADTRFTGDYHEVLREHAKAHGLPLRLLPALVQAFEAEPGDTLWHVANAFTRLATHGGLNARTAQGVQLSVGEYVGQFDMVTCRLPLPIARKVGAELLEESVA